MFLFVSFFLYRNKKYRQALASGSADMSVKIWDVTTQACQHTFTHHTDKVIVPCHIDFKVSFTVF